MATFKKRGVKGQEKWTVIFDLPGAKPRKQKRLSGFKSKQEANLAHISFVSEYKQERQHGARPTGATFQTVYDAYSKELRSRIKESSFASIKSNFNKHILPRFGSLRIDEIKLADISSLYTELAAARKLAHETRVKIHVVLSQFIEYCIAHKLIVENPCKKTPKFKNNEVRKDISIWSNEEFKKFINVVDDLIFKAFFSFLYLTGCRRGEALALNWQDIDGNIAKIRKTLNHHGLKRGYTITSPKTPCSNRDIMLPDQLVKLLQEVKKHYQQYEMFSKDNFVFGNIKPLHPENIRSAMGRCCKKAMVQKIRLHDLRHSHASLLISLGHDIVTIARRLGHSKVEMTLNTYAHMMPNKQFELVKSLNIDL